MAPRDADGLTASQLLARRLAGCVVLTADPDAQSTAWGMWQWCRDDHLAALARYRERGGALLAPLIDTLAAAPRDLAAFRALTAATTKVLDEDRTAAAALTDVVRALRQTARISAHIGADVTDTHVVAPLPTERILAGIDTSRPRPTADPVLATVVVPFRSTSADDGRARNLAACLASLDDQDLPRDRYRVVIVESDTRPRWQSVFGAYADSYVFAYAPGRFNKAWTVNCGVVHGGGPDELVCVLDGDLLLDPGFLSRCVARFEDDTLQGHWPYQHVLFADGPSSDLAVARRCGPERAAVDAERLRGTHLHRTPGGCVWVRRGLFDRMAGMDERLEGWGGEDNDFAWRAELYGGLERFDTDLLHLHHERCAPDTADRPPSLEQFPWCTWPADSPIGDLDKYRGDRPGAPRDQRP
ncbi:glycosyltransferase [Streptomyces luteocolor]|uniref:glycosyltransferase n=1 Tax=Streptomyces luteocolor TaxID=285500 RepID=UPI0009A03C17|nr:glycosyltransferase [Streptomyces luteocolor]